MPQLRTKRSQKGKKARRDEQQEVRDAVVIDVPSDKDDTGLDGIGSSEQRAMGPMDRFTLPIDSSKKLQQRKISEHVMKERSPKVKGYIARWLFIRGK
jgi:hypothetical protein